MAHIAFIAPPFLGHVNPMVALARELMGRGHRATFLHMTDAASVLDGKGVEFSPIGTGTHPPGHLRQVVRRMAGLRGLWGLGGVIRDVAAATEMLCRELPAALRAVGADAIVCDQTEAAGGLVADHLGIPLVSVANALPLNRESRIPPPFTGWRYDPSAWGVERNKGGYRVSDRLMSRHAAVIESYARRWALGPRRNLEDCVSRLAQISQTVPGFDFPRDELPETFHHCGPLRSGTLVPGFRMPASMEGRALAYASLGTLQGGRVATFRRIAEAARRAELRLVLAHGGGLTDEQTRTLPGSPATFSFVDQATVLARSELAILNGGLNTVMDSLAAGVPAIVVPIAFEQGAIAARIERSGAGLAVSRRLLTAGRLAHAIRRVRSEPTFRHAAIRLRAEILAAGGVQRAADIVERVLATGQPVLRCTTQERVPESSGTVQVA